MSKQRLGWICVAVWLVALAVILTVGVLRRPDAREANARRVQRGMTVWEVKRLLGEPQAFGDIPAGTLGVAEDGRPRMAGSWLSEEGEVVVVFTREGRVESVDFLRNPHPPETPLARLRAWLGW
jgi:hypothetical protein